MSYSPVVPSQSRTSTYPLFHSTRRKPRRWPLELRFFVKGAVHGAIVVPMALHALFAAVVVVWNRHYNGLGLSSVSNSIVGSLSIVVGLMLVFRNSTSYERFWAGRNNLTTVTTSVRNLSRFFLTNSHSHQCINSGKNSTILHQDNSNDNNKNNKNPTAHERADTERAVRTLLAIPFAIRNHLRGEWGSALPTSPPTPIASTPTHSRSLLYNPNKGSVGTGYGGNSNSSSYGSLGKAFKGNLFSNNDSNNNSNRNSNENYQSDSIATLRPEYVGLLPDDIRGLDDQGVGLPLLLCLMVEQYIRRCVDRSWFSMPQASQLTVQLNELTDAYGKMETIRITPVPVAHLIHQRQILALFNSVLPFAIVAQLHWWTVPIVCLVTFTLYGIEGIGSQLEDPFGYDRNDIKMDAIVEDARQETMVLLEEWKAGGSVFG